MPYNGPYDEDNPATNNPGSGKTHPGPNPSPGGTGGGGGGGGWSEFTQGGVKYRWHVGDQGSIQIFTKGMWVDYDSYLKSKDDPNNPNGPGGDGGGGGGSGVGGGAAPIIYGLSMAEKNSLAHQYWMVGQAYGYNIQSGMVQTLLNNAVSVTEFQQRLDAVRRMNEYKPYLDQFEKVVGKTLKPGDRLGFVLGKAPEDWYNIWEEASLRTAAVDAGITFGSGKEDLSLRGRDIRRLQAKLPGQLDEATMNSILQNYAQTIVNTGQFGRYFGGAGVSHSDVLDFAAGKASARTVSKIQGILASQQAFQTAKYATPQLSSTSGGGTTLLGLEKPEGQSL